MPGDVVDAGLQDAGTDSSALEIRPGRHAADAPGAMGNDVQVLAEHGLGEPARGLLTMDVRRADELSSGGVDRSEDGAVARNVVEERHFLELSARSQDVPPQPIGERRIHRADDDPFGHLREPKPA